MNSIPETQHVQLKTVKDLTKCAFDVPFVQRGYRWKPTQISELIDDLSKFRSTPNTKFYFLHVLSLAGGTKIIDGQQRLTTLSILLQELGETGMRLNYARAPNRFGALDEYFRSQARTYIHERVKTISSDDQQRLKETVLEAKFLIHDIPAHEETVTFRRLNSGKISVSDSELVKCVLLTPQFDEPFSQTLSRADEWDSMERAFRSDDFFSFVTPRGTWMEDDRMSILLRVAGINPLPEERESQNHPFLAAFQRELKTNSRESLWQKMCSAFANLQFYFDSPLWYSAIGWGLHSGRVQLGPDIKGATLDRIRELNSLLQRIVNDDELYYNNQRAAHAVLLLFNVAICWKRGDRRYPFAKHRSVKTWSLEHVFARNQRVFVDEKDFNEYCHGQVSSGSFEDYQKAENKDIYLKMILGDQYPDGEINGLENLALLGQCENSSLLNGLFLEKEAKIAEMIVEQKGFVPPATELIFHKAYPHLDRRLAFLNKTDMDWYVHCIKTTLNDFLTSIEKADEVTQ